jgi:hypothetical protein
MVKGYCVKCKEKGVEMKDVVIEQTPRGVFMAKGKCPTCGTSMCVMMSKDNAQKAIENNEAKKGF